MHSLRLIGASSTRLMPYSVCCRMASDQSLISFFSCVKAQILGPMYCGTVMVYFTCRMQGRASEEGDLGCQAPWAISHPSCRRESPWPHTTATLLWYHCFR